jgi:hypothetical protein
MATILIDVDVQNNHLICGANGGNARGYPGTKILWRSRRPDEVKFSLEFFQFGLEDSEQRAHRISALRRWPFTGDPPHGAIVPDTTEFAGTLFDENERDPHAPAPAFKYSVRVGNLHLDPIVIVDKRT